MSNWIPPRHPSPTPGHRQEGRFRVSPSLIAFAFWLSNLSAQEPAVASVQDSNSPGHEPAAQVIASRPGSLFPLAEKDRLPGQWTIWSSPNFRRGTLTLEEDPTLLATQPFEEILPVGVNQFDGTLVRELSSAGAPLVANSEASLSSLSISSTFAEWNTVGIPEVEDPFLSPEITTVPESAAWMYGLLTFATLVVMGAGTLPGWAAPCQAAKALRSPSPKERTL